MKRKILIPGEISLGAGLVLLSFTVPLMLSAGIGVSTIASPVYALNSIYRELSFGSWNLLFHASLLVLLLSITKQFRTGYLVSFVIAVIFGYLVDFFSILLANIPTDIPWRVLYFGSSLAFFCVAISLMVISRLPLMITDAIVRDLSLFLHITYRRAKTIFDISCIALSVGLSMVFLGNLASVGVGTIIMASITGTGVYAVNRALSRVITVKPWSSTLSKMAEIRVDTKEKGIVGRS